MTWLSTWSKHNITHYAEHASETAAKGHAEQMHRSGLQATWFWMSDEEESA